MVIGHQPPEFLLAVEGLTVSFDGFKAVNDLSFYVEENEIRVIIGPNGAGKTTVLDLICGKTQATAGSIRFRGKELTALKENQIVKAGVGRKFQTPVDLRRSHRVREPRNLLSARPHRVRRARLQARRGRARAGGGGRRDDLPEGSPRHERRSAQPRAEAMAGDRHAADPGPGAADARRAGGRHERQRAGARPPSSCTPSSRTARCW